VTGHLGGSNFSPIGYANGVGVVQRLIHFDPRLEVGESRIEATIPPNAKVLIVTYPRAHFSETDRHIAAASVGISASHAAKDRAAARREIDHASEAIWMTSTIVIDDRPHSVSVHQLLGGPWVGYVQYEGTGIALGALNIDMPSVRLATVDPSTLSDRI
jgi:hypothetical protein